MSAPALDSRIARGMAAQLARRRERLGAGERAVGWKVGFGSPAAMAKLGIDRPLVGFLTDRGAIAGGQSCSLAGWANPILEPEIAVHLARDVAAGAGRRSVQEAIAGLGTAIELVDVDPPPSDVETILAGNIFHRAFALGPVDRGRRTPAGVSASIRRDGSEIASTDDPAAMTGDLVEIVRQTAELLAASGERLRAGEVVITGSVVAPFAVAAGERIDVTLTPLGSLSVVMKAAPSDR